jgi:hypothetical protein
VRRQRITLGKVEDALRKILGREPTMSERVTALRVIADALQAHDDFSRCERRLEEALSA